MSFAHPPHASLHRRRLLRAVAVTAGVTAAVALTQVPNANAAPTYGPYGTGGLATGTSPQAVLAVSSLDRVFVANVSAGSVTVIKESTGAVLATVSVGTAPTSLAADPAEDRLYVGNSDSNSVSAIDTTTNTVSSTITLSGAPTALSVDTTDHVAYVGESAAGQLEVIDTTTDVLDPTPITLANGALVSDVLADGARNTVYVSDADNGEIYPIDVSTPTASVGAGIAVSGAPTALSLDATNHLVYIAQSTGDTVSTLDETTDTVVGTPIAVGATPNDIVVDPATNILYVVELGPKLLARYDATNGTAKDSFSTTAAPGELGYDPTTRRSFVTVPSSNVVLPFGPYTAPVISLNPSSTTATDGGSVTLTAAATGTPPATVQWEKSIDGGSTYTPIAGATSTSYTYNAAASNPGTKYRAVFTNAAGTATTTAATVTVLTGTVAGRSLTGSLTARLDGSAVWTDLGGRVVDTPIVVQGAGQHTLFITRSTDDSLWVRGTTGSWARLTPAGTYCADPDATISGTTLTVTCRTLSGLIAYGTGTVPSSGLPTVTSLTSLGGKATSGAAVWVNGGTTTVATVGQDGHTVYTKTTALGASWASTTADCSATPSALVYSGHSYLVCRTTAGKLGVSRDGAAQTTSGVIVGRVGISAGATTPMVSVEGQDARIYDTTLNTTTGASGSFTGSPQKVTSGVTAATSAS